MKAILLYRAACLRRRIAKMRMNSSRYVLVSSRASLLVLLLILSPLSASVLAASTDQDLFEQSLIIRDLSLDDSVGGLAVSLRVTGISEDQMKETVETGSPWLLSFRLELFRHRWLFPDRRVESWNLAHTVRYDNLKDEYVVTREITMRESSGSEPAGSEPPGNERSGAERLPPTAVKGLQAARILAVRVTNFPIGVSRKNSFERYTLRVRARVEPINKAGESVLDRFLSGFALIPRQRQADWYTEEFEY